MHIKCFNSVTGINSTYKIDRNHVSALFSGYFQLIITLPILNTGEYGNTTINGIKVPIGRQLALPQIISHGCRISHSDQLNDRRKCPQENWSLFGLYEILPFSKATHNTN